jgi:hypothetical protein
MRKKLMGLFCVVLCVFGLVACADREPDISVHFSEDGTYLGFEDVPEYATSDDALEDGCFVVVSDSDGGGLLYGGQEYWAQFLQDSGNGDDAFLRVVQFIDGTAYVSDLLYTGDTFHYFDAESEDLSDRPYQHLRELTGNAGSPEKEITWYVLTDSLDLSFEDAILSIVSSSMNVIESTPDFCWLGFTTYLDDK